VEFAETTSEGGIHLVLIEYKFIEKRFFIFENISYRKNLYQTKEVGLIIKHLCLTVGNVKSYLFSSMTYS